MTETPAPRLQAWTQLLMACGVIPTVLVAVGGASVGAAVWHAIAGAFAPALAGLAFIVLTCGIALLALAAWMRTGIGLALRSGYPPVELMRIDAWSYAALTVSGFTFALPLGSAPGVTATWISGIAFVAGKLVTIARFDAATRAALYAFVLSRIPVVAVAELSPYLLGTRPLPAEMTANPWLAVWTRWDGVHYLEIARHGYAGNDFAFFPLYPMLIRILAPVFGSDVAAGLVISNVAFFAALVIVWRIVELEFDAEAAGRTVVLIAIFPAAVFFSAVYTESLFLALTAGSFYALRCGRRLLAGVIGGFAAATRVEGVLLIVPYLIDALLMSEVPWHAYLTSKLLRQQLALGAAFIGMGLLVFMAFVGLLTGNPFAFEHVQSHWQRHLAPPWAGIERSFALISHAHRLQGVTVQSIELAFTLFALVLLACSVRLLRRDEWGYAFASLLLPLCTSSLMSMPRFAVVVFPLFTALAVWAQRSSAFMAAVLVFAPLLGMFTLLFANWYWIA